jgi:putative flippase GtrA
VNLLRRFVLIGTIATLADVGLLCVLRLQWGWPVALADALAVAVATGVSWLLHGWLTLPDDPSQRFYRSAGPYLGTASLALVADVAVVSLLDLALDPRRVWALVLIKLPALFVAFVIRVANYRRAMFTFVREDQRRPLPRPPARGDARLSVVVPAFRESDRIADSIDRIREELASIADAGGLEVVVVDDGSDDDTAAVARSAGADQVVVLEHNRGKGAAVRAGVLASTGRTVAFIDADLAYAPSQLLKFVERIEDGWDVAVGSRQHTDTLTVVRAGRLREVGGRVVNVLTGIVLLGRYRDTQCGLKAMRSDAAELVFSHCTVDRFAFDVEVFHLVERYRLTLVEVPVTVVNSSRSTVRIARDTSRLVRDLFSIRRHARLGDYELSPGEFMQRSPADGPGGTSAAH